MVGVSLPHAPSYTLQIRQLLVAFVSANFCLVLTFPCPFHSPHACATRACSTPGQPLSSYKPCAPHALLCSPHGARQSCLSNAWCVLLLPSRAYAIRVCPTLGCSLSWIPHLGRINATRCEVVCSLCRCCWHSCLLCSVLAAPTVRAMRVCPPLIMSFSCLSYELLPSVSAQSLMRVAPARHSFFSSPRFHVRRIQDSLTHSHCMSARLDTCSHHRTCHACLPATYYVLLLPFPRASAICVCAKSHARCPSTSFVLLFPSLPYAPYTTFPQALTLSPLLNVGRGPAPWPDKQLCVAVSSSCRCFKHSCLRHTWRPPQTSSLA